MDIFNYTKRTSDILTIKAPKRFKELKELNEIIFEKAFNFLNYRLVKIECYVEIKEGKEFDTFEVLAPFYEVVDFTDINEKNEDDYIKKVEFDFILKSIVKEYQREFKDLL